MFVRLVLWWFGPPLVLGAIWLVWGIITGELSYGQMVFLMVVSILVGVDLPALLVPGSGSSYEPQNATDVEYFVDFCPDDRMACISGSIFGETVPSPPPANVAVPVVMDVQLFGGTKDDFDLSFGTVRAFPGEESLPYDRLGGVMFVPLVPDEGETVSETWIWEGFEVTTVDWTGSYRGEITVPEGLRYPVLRVAMSDGTQPPDYWIGDMIAVTTAKPAE